MSITIINSYDTEIKMMAGELTHSLYEMDKASYISVGGGGGTTMSLWSLYWILKHAVK